ncbi:Substance-K receptor [Trichoplax sp. H2]|nr:Substance-K receptor [Trichoplax sp. H2]|eukprot:RDD37927.1 Substance-K receptor [Trichoplax sp. H2]
MAVDDNKVIGIFNIIVIVVSIPSNALILLTMTLNKKLRSPTNLLVGNLSIASLAIAIFRMPVKTYELFHPKQGFPFGNSIGMCRFQQILPSASVFCISLTLTTICVDRYIAIMHPMKQHLKLSLRKVYIFIPCSWIVSFACFGVYASYMATIEVGPAVYCLPIYPPGPADIFVRNATGYVMATYRGTKVSLWACFIIFAFLIPSAVMTVLYSITARFLWSRTGPGDKITTVRVSETRRRLQQKRRVVGILIACCVIFIGVNLPYYFLFMLLDLGQIVIPNVGFVVNLLILINLSCIVYNPVIYGFFNPSIRISIANLLRRVVGIEPQRMRATTATSVVNGPSSYK